MGMPAGECKGKRQGGAAAAVAKIVNKYLPQKQKIKSERSFREWLARRAKPGGLPMFDTDVIEHFRDGWKLHSEGRAGDAQQSVLRELEARLDALDIGN
jgi:hypothetical protein